MFSALAPGCVRCRPGSRRARTWRGFGSLALALVGLWFGLGAIPAEAATTAIPLRGPYRYEQGWYHKVQRGESLAVLGARFGVEPGYLAESNHLKPGTDLVAGTLVYVPPRSGKYHHVAGGDTLTGVARKYRLDVDYLAAANRITRSARLRVGEVLVIPTRCRPVPVGSASPPPAVYYGSRSGTGSHTQSGSGSGRPSPSSRSGGSSGSSTTRTPGSEQRSSVSGMVDLPARRLQVPSSSERGGSTSRDEGSGGASASSSPSRAVRSSGGSSASSSPQGSISRRRSSDGRPALQWPFEGTITRRYVNEEDKKHRGVDIAGPIGTPIHAAADGTVIYSGNDIPGYGTMVIIDHGRGWATCYAHNSANLVKKDQHVGAGQVVAKVGESGRATGPHCHFEVRYRYEAVDPMPLLP